MRISRIIIKQFLFSSFVLFPFGLAIANNVTNDTTDRDHPFLFFSEEDIPSIRERIAKEPFASRWNKFKQNAEKVLNSSYYDVKDNAIYRSRKYLEIAGKTAFAYAITGKEKYAEKATKVAMAMVSGGVSKDQGKLVWYNSSYRNWNKGADLSTAEICYGLAMVYDWCHDYLDEKKKEKIKSALLEKGINQYLVSLEGKKPGEYNVKGDTRRDWWVDNLTTNWAGVVHGGVGLSALLLFDESERAREAVSYAREYVPRFLDHVFLKDGGGHEGIMYARYGEIFSLYFLMAEQRLFGLNNSLLKKFNQRLAGYWDVYMLGPDQKYANFNDMNEKPNTTHSDILAFMENLVPGGDSLLLWGADNGNPRFTWSGSSPWYFLWRRAEVPSTKGKEKPRLQEAVLFRGAGHAILRSSNMWLAYNGGWISDKSHYNCDLGSFVFVLDKERMVHDPGYDHNHTRQHSTVTINGKDQIKGKSGEYLRFGSGDSFHYFATDLSAAYDKTYLNQFIRHVIMVKDSYIVLFDEVDLKKPADITCHLQTRAPAKVYNQKDALINGSANKLYVLNAASEQTQTSIEGWKEKNEELNAIRTKIPGAQSDNLIVTVLLPADQKEEGQEEVPKASFEKGQLTIKDGDGNKDLIIFTEGQHRWHLKSVNGEDAGHISSGDERTLEPFRKNPDNNIPVNRLPSWFFPDKQIMN